MAFVAEETSYEFTWASLDRYECPEWFRDAKFGIYAHWRPYSAAEGVKNTDWYLPYMYMDGHPVNPVIVFISGNRRPLFHVCSSDQCDR